MWPHHVWGNKCVCQVDPRVSRHGPDKELNQAHGPAVGFQQVPLPVNNNGRIRLLLRQHVVQGFSHATEFLRGELALAPDRRETSRAQQHVWSAQADALPKCGDNAPDR